ncbi:MAG: hypothetical protein CMK92_05840 [Pseudomonas sp.]|nr:hypothetical protein [Pseudomonas sp.]|tara:strand:+ start:114 stop:383 length:270 start_codon:yes stop_codon:yes gene_type:complete
MAAIGREIIEQLGERKMADIALLESQNKKLIELVNCGILTEEQKQVIHTQIALNDTFISEKNEDIKNLLLLHSQNDNGAMLMQSNSDSK